MSIIGVKQLASQPEAAMLLYGGDLEMGPATRSSMRKLIEGPFDWESFLEKAMRHRMISLLYRTLKNSFSDIVPEPILGRMSLLFRRCAQHNLTLTGEMLRLVKAFSAVGILSVPLKGPMLALAAYGDISSRQFGDIDLLIPPTQIDVAKNILLSYGYRLERELSRSQETAYIKSEHAFRFYHAKQNTAIELHWRLNDRRLAVGLDNEELWNKLVDVTAFGHTFKSLDPETLILYLAVHGAKHYWEQLEWICSFGGVVKANPSVDWDRIFKTASETGTRRILQLGLMLANDLYHTTHTKGALQKMPPDPMTRVLADHTWVNMFTEPQTITDTEKYRYTFYLKTRERLRDRLQVVQHASIRIPHPESRDWIENSLPAHLDFLYYVTRPVRLLKQHGFRALKGVLRPTPGF